MEKATSDWVVKNPMVSGRANFAIQMINNTIYVFGGVQSLSEEWRPNLCQNIIEKYMPQEDLWMTMKIPNTPFLAAFSWCSTSERLIILGGTDGSFLNSDLFIIDFIGGGEPTCTRRDTNFEF